MSDDWYRNEIWTPEIEAEFNARIARTRGQKAQYLRIQGSMLAGRDPEAALALLRRCIELADDWTLAPAHQDSGYAYYRLGKVETAVGCLQAAVDQQVRFPAVKTDAPHDYCMLVAVHSLREHYPAALGLIPSLLGLFPLSNWKAEGAQALILWDEGRHEEARAAAARASAAESIREGWVPGHPQVGIVPAQNLMSSRLAAILASS